MVRYPSPAPSHHFLGSPSLTALDRGLRRLSALVVLLTKEGRKGGSGRKPDREGSGREPAESGVGSELVPD